MTREKTVVSKLIRRTGLFLFGLIIFTTVLIGLQASSHKADALSNANTLNFQARLLTNSGAIVPDGTYNIDFRLYSSASGSPVDVNTSTMASCSSPCEWEEAYAYAGFSGTPGTYSGSVGPQLTVKDGYVSVYLGTYAPFPSTINWSIPQYLTMDIDENGTTASGAITWDGEMVATGNNRIQLTSVPSAFTANQLETNSGSNAGTLSWGNGVSNNPVIYLPNVAGTNTLCLENDSTDCGYAPGTAASYIENQTSPQTANFNITGTGTTVNSVASGTLTIGSCSSTCSFASGNPTSDNVNFENGSNNNVITLNAGATTSSYFLTLPTGPPQSNQCIMTASTSTTQLVYGACNGGPTLQFINEWDMQNASPSGKTLSLSILNSSTSAPGDVVVLAVEVPSVQTGMSIPSTSGNVGNWQQVTAAQVTGTGAAASKVYLFYGTVINPNNATVTVTGNVNITGSIPSHMMAMEFSSGNGAGTIWTAYNGTPQQNTSSSTSVTYSSITSHVAGELYWSYGFMPGVSTLSSPGACGSYNCYPDTAGGTAARETQAAYTVNTTATDVYSATGTQTTSDPSAAVGAMFAASAGSYINDGTTPQNANFNVVSASASSVAGTIEGNIGQTADILDVDYQSATGVAIPVLSVGAQGNTAVNTITNTVNAFQINATSGGVVSANALNVDTTNLSVDNGSLSMASTTPTIVQAPSAAPTFTQGGTGASTSYAYEITAVGNYGGESLGSPVGTDSSGPATLTFNGNYNIVHFTSVTGVTYKIYRTSNGGSVGGTGLIGTVTASSTSTTFNDFGYTGAGTAPALASTGGLTTADAYIYEVAAFDSQGGQSTVSNQTGGSCTTATVKNMLISWPAVNGAAYYRVYRGWNTIASCTSLSESDYMTTYSNFISDSTTTWSTAGTPNVSATGYINNLTANGTANIVLGNGGVDAGVQLYLGGNISSFSSSTPSYGSTTTSLGTPQVEAIQGHYLYVEDSSSNGVQVFDISNPSSPILVSTITSGGFGSASKNLMVSGNYLYNINSSGSQVNLTIENITNPASPVGVTGVVLNSSTPNTTVAAVLSGRYIYVAEQTPAQFQVVDITSVGAPVVVSTTALNLSVASTSIGISGNYLYVGSANSPYYTQIYDVTNPASPIFISDVQNSTSTEATNMTISGGYMYTDGNSKFTIWSLANPGNPVQLYNGSLSNVQTNSIRVYGNYLYMPTGTSSGGTVVYDVSNPFSPVLVGSIDSSNASNDVVVQGDFAYEINVSAQLNVWALGGELVQNLQTGSDETNTLIVDNSTTLNGKTTINGSLNVAGSVLLSGNVGVSGFTVFKNYTGSTTAFSIDNATGSTLFNVDTASNSSDGIITIASTAGGEIILGNSSNGITYTYNGSTTSNLRYNGAARNTKYITLTPEYAGAALSSCQYSSSGCSGLVASGADVGTMTASNTPTGVSSLPENYYEWTTAQGSNESYDIVVSIPIPTDFSAWSSSTPLTVDVNTSSTTNGTVTGWLYDTAGASVTAWNSGCALTPGSATTWTTVTGCSMSTGTYTATGGKSITLVLQVQAAATGGITYIGNVSLSYLSAF